MRGNARSLWMVGAGVVALLLLLVGWMLLISPQLDAASASRAEEQETIDSTTLLRARVASLAEDHANLATLQSELDTLHTQFPTGLDLTDFVRRLAAMAEASGASVQSVSRSEPAVREDVTTVWQVPVNLTVTGTHDQILAYLDQLQGVDDRLFLVDSLNTTTGNEDGQMTASITGYTFVLPETSSSATTDATTTATDDGASS
jgi:Tfp pilus assembly protein PilO